MGGQTKVAGMLQEQTAEVPGSGYNSGLERRRSLREEFPLDVHPPHGPIHSIQEFMVHLRAITIGLLIALRLEATVEWRHHRSLASEAGENISHEIRDNVSA